MCGEPAQGVPVVMPYKNKSPSKKLRNIQRLLSFHLKKSAVKGKPVLTICPQVAISFLPTKPMLETSRNPSISINPGKTNLAICQGRSISIPGRRIFDPAILQACHSMFGKHPDLLDHAEIAKFNHYIQYKIAQGDPIESSIIYTPAGGAKKCLQCGELT